MRYAHVGWGVIGVLLVLATEANAGGFAAGGFTPMLPGSGPVLPGTFGGGGLAPGSFGGGSMIGMSGFGCGPTMIGTMSGMPMCMQPYGGQFYGTPPITFGGCCGGTFRPGCCGGISGFPCGCCGGFTGCTFMFPPGGFGTIQHPQGVTQFYTAWTKTPGRAYHHRSLFIYFPAPLDKHQEFLVVHYADRPGELYFFDPVQRHYFAKYRIGAKAEACFTLVAAKARRNHLKEIPDSAYAPLGPMPTMAQLGVLSPAMGTDVMRNVQMRRPPSALPDESSHLPPDEAVEKK